MLKVSKLIACISALAFYFGADCSAREAGGRVEAKKTLSSAQSLKGPVFTYRQTGGFVSVRRLYEQQLGALPEAQRIKLEHLIKSSGLPSIKGEQKLTQGACDVFYYDFTLKDRAGSHHAVFDDVTLPQSYRPLVQYLKDKVKDEKRSVAQPEAK